MKKPHGYITPRESKSGLLMPSSPKKPSGTVDVVKIEDSTATVVPLPVALSWSTIFKIASVSIVALVGAGSTVAYYVHSTQSHMADPAIHLSRGERSTLETKKEAQANRKKMLEAVNRESTMRQREVLTEQKQQIQDLGDRLQKRQQSQFRQLRRAIRAVP